MSEVPGLAYNPANEITAEDIPTPWVLFAQGQTKADVEYGSIYTAMGSEVKQIAEPAKGTDVPGPGVRFYVLAGPQKRFGIINEASETWIRNTEHEAAALPNVKKGPFPVYDYVIGLPDVDQQLPYKVRFKRTGEPAAKDINIALFFAGAGNESKVAFELSLVKKQTEFKFVVPQVRKIDVPALQAGKDAEVLERLSALAGVGHRAQQLEQETTTTGGVEAPSLD